MSTHSTSPYTHSTSLSTYGFDAHWRELATSVTSPGEPGRVTVVDRGGCGVGLETGFRRVLTVGHDVCTGDWVVVDNAAVTAVLPRRTAIVRATAGGTSASQTLASNVDTVVITVAADVGLDLGRVERYLTLAWDSGATPLLVVTKCDKSSAASFLVDDLLSAAPGVSLATVSSVTGDGIDELLGLLVGTTAVIGPSGSGKSTLANTLVGDGALDTGDVRSADSKGRHTTVRRELLRMPVTGQCIIDTPGLRSVGLVASEAGLHQTFLDIDELAGHCRFNDCSHRSEPGCAVRDAVDPRRIANYHRLERENHWATTRRDARENQKRLAEAKAISKAQRRMYKARSEW